MPERISPISRRDFCWQLAKAGASVLIPSFLTPDLFSGPTAKEKELGTQPVYYRLPPEKYQPEEVALTLDDCWRPDKLAKILDVVEKEKIPLTIFPAGIVFRAIPVKVEDKKYSFKEQLIRAAELGCCFGNHTVNHQNLNKLSLNKAKQEIECGYEALRENLPQTARNRILPILRPPGGGCSDFIKEAIKDNPFVKSLVLWNCSSEGGSYPGDGKEEEKMKEGLVKQIIKTKYQIILLHTISNDTRIFPWLVDYLRSSNHRLVDLSRLA